MSKVFDAIFGENEIVFWARFHTRLAAYAFLLCVEFDRLGRYAFRVVAPHASEWTSLQKYGGAYAWAIVDGKSFDVENKSHVFSLQTCMLNVWHDCQTDDSLLLYWWCAASTHRQMRLKCLGVYMLQSYYKKTKVMAYSL